MAEKLENALRSTLNGWRDAVPTAWQAALAAARPDFAAVARHRILIDPWVPIFPPLKKLRKKDILGSPPDAEIFRSLKQVSPGRVRVVVVGQDPYPDVTKATGTSFEQGGLRDWAGAVSKSLKPVLQNAAADKTGDDGYRDGARGWAKLSRDVASNSLRFAKPNKLFGAYGKQGVLWLNTTLTISLFKWTPNHQKAHADMWKPIVGALFRHIAKRSNRNVVFALWGTWARSFESDIRRYAEDAGTSDQVAFAKAGHPVTKPFLIRANPLSAVNDRLAELGEARVRWLPS